MISDEEVPGADLIEPPNEYDNQLINLDLQSEIPLTQTGHHKSNQME